MPRPPAGDSRASAQRVGCGLAAVWGAAGLAGLLAYAIARLLGVIVAGAALPWDWPHWIAAAANAAFMAWSEGYRGFQLRFSPRCAARVKWLAQNPAPLRGLLAPLFVMGYFGAPRSRVIATSVLTIAIVIAIVVVHALPQPWRAVLDIGVVIGLSWGLATFGWWLWRVFRAADCPVSPEVSAPASRVRKARIASEAAHDGTHSTTGAQGAIRRHSR